MGIRPADDQRIRETCQQQRTLSDIDEVCSDCGNGEHETQAAMKVIGALLRRHDTEMKNIELAADNARLTERVKGLTTK